MLRYSFSILLLLSACESFDYNVSDEFRPFVNIFFEEAARYGYDFDKDNLVIKFKDSLAQKKGYAAYSVLGYNKETENRIYVDTEIWNRSSYAYNELTIFHECGHIFLCRTHQVYPIGVMNSPPDVGQWESRREEMIRELFSKKSCNY